MFGDVGRDLGGGANNFVVDVSLLRLPLRIKIRSARTYSVASGSPRRDLEPTINKYLIKGPLGHEHLGMWSHAARPDGATKLGADSSLRLPLRMKMREYTYRVGDLG